LVKLFEVFKASGVLVEQKSVRRTCSPFAPVGRQKGDDLKISETDKKRDMEPVREKRKQAGRPAKIIKKEIRTAVRFTKIEYFVIRQKAARAGIKISAYVRQTAINAEVITRLNEEERHFVRQLIGMSTNLNQLAKNSHSEGMLKTMFYFETFRNHIDLILKKLNHGQ